VCCCFGVECDGGGCHLGGEIRADDFGDCKRPRRGLSVGGQCGAEKWVRAHLCRGGCFRRDRPDRPL
jgi:hypothetical protein